jgi:hypothetical protein
MLVMVDFQTSLPRFLSKHRVGYHHFLEQSVELLDLTGDLFIVLGQQCHKLVDYGS